MAGKKLPFKNYEMAKPDKKSGAKKPAPKPGKKR